MTEGFNSFNGSQNEMRALINEMRALNNTMARSTNKNGDFRNTDKNTEILKSLQDTMKSINSMAGGTKSLDDSIKKFGSLIDKYNRGGTTAKEQQEILKQLEGMKDSLGDLNVNIDKGLDHLYDLSKDATKTDKERADALRIVLKGIEDQGMTLNEDIALLANKSEISADQLKNSTNMLKIISKNSNLDTQRSFDMNRNLEAIKENSKLDLGHSAELRKGMDKLGDSIKESIGNFAKKTSGNLIEGLIRMGGGKLADAGHGKMAVGANMVANFAGSTAGSAVGLGVTALLGHLGLKGLGKVGGKLTGKMPKIGGALGAGLLAKSTAVKEFAKTLPETLKGAKSIFSKSPSKALKALPSLETPLEALDVGGSKLLAKEGEKVVAKEGLKLGEKAVGKSVAKKIPGLGVLMGLGFGAGRLMKGDAVGAAGEVASGVLGGTDFVSGPAGIGGSLAIDAWLASRDMKMAKGASKLTEVSKIAGESKPIGLSGMRKKGLIGAGAVGAGIVAMNMSAGASQASEIHSERASKNKDLKSVLEDVFAPLLKPEKRGLFSQIGESLSNGADTANRVGNGIVHRASQAVDTAKSFVKQHLPNSVWRGDNKPINPSDLANFSGAGLNVANSVFKTDKPMARKDFVQSLAKVDGEMKKKYGKSFTMTGGYGGEHDSPEHRVYGTAADMTFAGSKEEKAYLESRLKAHGMAGIEHNVGKGLHYHVVHKESDPTTRPVTPTVAQNKTRVQPQSPEHQANAYSHNGTKDKSIAEMSNQIIQGLHKSSDKIASAVVASASSGNDKTDRRLSTKSNIIFSKNNIGVLA